ncbi:hypothetical protein GpartN1_g3787.t1 [Galdieria partita]|uniref:Uncharacterized protein n=1 Tax=Galdieria partita TaxID=83374 RepID=A0A9C7UQS1_9RHOD|nr:hypothetical protein GpartN1_g3787.t1 [Galdieria partita]
MDASFEQDFREYQRLQSIKYYTQKMKKSRPLKQFVLGQAKQPNALHERLEPYVSLAAQRWRQHRSQTSRDTQQLEKQSSPSKLLSEKSKLGRIALEEPVAFAATNNWLCKLPLTIFRTVEGNRGPLYRELASSKYDNYVEALESTSSQIKKRFRNEYCRNVVHSQTLFVNENNSQIEQTIPKEYVDLATWRYQQFVQMVGLNSLGSKKNRQDSSLGTYSAKLGGGDVPLSLEGDYSHIDTIDDYRSLAAHRYWLRMNTPNVASQGTTQDSKVSSEQQRGQLFIDPEYSKKPDSLYRKEAHRKYELYLQSKRYKAKQDESNSSHSTICNDNIFLSQPAVLFQRSNHAVPYHIHYENIDRLPLFHSKVMNRFF